MSQNSFGAKATLEVGARGYEIFRLDALQQRFDVARLPFSLKILLENLLRTEGNGSVTAADIEALAGWDAKAQPSKEIAFSPARVLMQDFTGVPAVVDLAAMRDAMADMGGEPAEDQPAGARRAGHRPLRPGGRLRHARRIRLQRRARVRAKPGALRLPALGSGRLRRLRGGPARHGHRPPGQPRVPRASGVPQREGRRRPTPTRWWVPTRTPRWSTGLACSAGAWAGSRPRRRCSASPSRCSSRRCSGFELHGALPEGTTATDLVLTVTQLLRAQGVVGCSWSSTAPAWPRCRSPIARPSATCRPSSAQPARSSRSTPRRSRYLELSGRSSEQIALVEAYAKAQGLWHDKDAEEPTFSDTLELDLAHSRAQPRRSQAPPGQGRPERRPELLQRGAAGLRAQQRRAADSSG